MKLLLMFWVSIFSFNQQNDKPSFKGGEKELQSFLEQQMIYPDFSKNNCIEATILISFQLDDKGNVYNEKLEQGIGIDLDEEALRLVKLTSGKWNISENDNIRLNIPIHFSLDGYNCHRRNADDIKKAIAYYSIRENLENTVFNYYKNKEIGKANPKDEPKIEQLKKDLGFDDEFISYKLEEARKMLKQNNIERACKILSIIKSVGSDKADRLIAQYCN